MRALCLVVVVAACQSAKPQPSPIASRANEPPAPTFESEFARSLELDYRYPKQQRPKARVGELLAAKCRGGDRGACLRGSMATLGKELRPEIEANCKAGDDLSCRAEAAVKIGFRDQYPFKLSNAELRRGCAAGLWAECDLLMESDVALDVRFGAEVSCIESKLFCWIAGDNYLNSEPRDLDRARYLLELGCQYSIKDCVSLAVAYVEGFLPEPVKGRGIDLVRLMCARDPNDQCKQGKVPWALPDDKPVFTP